MKLETPLYLRESEYHREKKIEKYWTIALVTLVSFGTLYFSLHLIAYLIK